MNGRFTEEDMLQVAYDEISYNLPAIRDELECNPDLKTFYQDVLRVKHQLERAKVHPNHSSVDIILEHSGSFSSLETH